MPRHTRPEEHPDPVDAVFEAHRTGALLALATSGSSGTDVREVLRTTTSWWCSFDAYSGLTGIRTGSRVWVPGPLRSTMNLFAAVHARWAGAELTDDPATATDACLTPTQLDQRGHELPGGTAAVVAGAHLSAPAARRAADRGLRVAHYYGAAELSFVAWGTSAADLTPFPEVEVEVRDEPREGTVWVRSPYLCDGYDGAHGALVRDADGWATVGDLGRLDDGTLTVLGRPDVIVTAGATVLIDDVERALASVARGPIAVHAVTHPTMGQLVAVTLTDASDRASLERHARAHLPSSHRPRAWQVVPLLPLTAGGKPDRARLQEQAG
jgi:acyl-coenzyme A synthetase/AMP-(fatty) acid ligase